MKLDDINFTDQSIRVIGKGNKERIVCGSEIVFIRLKEWINIRSGGGCPEVFVRIGKHGDLRLNQKLSPMAIFKMLQKERKPSGSKNSRLTTLEGRSQPECLMSGPTYLS